MATDAIQRLAEIIRRDEPLFSVTAPIKVTAKLKDGRWAKLPTIGDEPMIATGCYTGKRDLIFAFQWQNGPSNVEQVEMRLDDARKYLKGFGEYVEHELNQTYDELVQEVQEKLRGKQKPAKRVKKRRSKSEETEKVVPTMPAHYGSW